MELGLNLVTLIMIYIDIKICFTYKLSEGLSKNTVMKVMGSMCLGGGGGVLKTACTFRG